MTRCSNCNREVKQEFRNAGKVYCSKLCQEYAALTMIEKAARMQSPWYVVVDVIAVLFALSIINGPAKAHDPYSGWLIPGQNKSCCNMQDCKPTRAKFENKAWWAFVASKRIWVKIPEDKIVKYKTDDTDAHLCFSESQSEVLCFREPVGSI